MPISMPPEPKRSSATDMASVFSTDTTSTFAALPNPKSTSYTPKPRRCRRRQRSAVQAVRRPSVMVGEGPTLTSWDGEAFNLWLQHREAFNKSSTKIMSKTTI
ncbi:hypothetical protein OsJ_16072 [Oryza sativa Japonica Group]|uniref:Uncharacterized protein n=2 Tax=Oryza TaxID=4527 RepID=A3AX68_ORYSJ|nr:hypothetical protein OsJ_16072 [Oryza sativa Japonica Group]